MSSPVSLAGMGEAGKRLKWIDAHCRDKRNSAPWQHGGSAGRGGMIAGLLSASYSETSRLCVKPVGLGFVLNREVTNPPAAHHSHDDILDGATRRNE